MYQKSAAIFFYCCIVAAIVIYFPSSLYFLNDDFIHIPLSAKADFFQHHSFRPVAELSLYCDYILWGTNAVGYHFTNLVIHLLCCFFLFRFIYIFLKRYAALSVQEIKYCSFISAGIFLIYPFHSEAILWILGRGSSLCTLFFLISMMCWLKKEKHVMYFLLSLVFFTAGLFTYESIWVMPILISLLHFYEKGKRKKEKQQTIFLICFMIVFLVYILIRYMVLDEFISEYEHNGLKANFLLNIFLNYNRLLARSFLPPMSFSFMFGICYTLLMLIFIILIIQKRKQIFSSSTVSLLLLMFLFSLTPFVCFGIDTHTAESERYLYLPSVFLCIITGYFLAGSKSFKKVFHLVLIFIFSYNIFFAFSNSRDHRIAGNTSKEVLQSIEPYTRQNQKIEINNLPIQLKSAPVFRKGFKEAAAWLYQADTGNITIHNTVTLTNGPQYFTDFFSTNPHLNIQATKKVNDTIILDILPDRKFFEVIHESR